MRGCKNVDDCRCCLSNPLAISRSVTVGFPCPSLTLVGLAVCSLQSAVCILQWFHLFLAVQDCKCKSGAYFPSAPQKILRNTRYQTEQWSMKFPLSVCVVLPAAAGGLQCSQICGQPTGSWSMISMTLTCSSLKKEQSRDGSYIRRSSHKKS